MKYVSFNNNTYTHYFLGNKKVESTIDIEAKSLSIKHENIMQYRQAQASNDFKIVYSIRFYLKDSNNDWKPNKILNDKQPSKIYKKEVFGQENQLKIK